MSRTYFYALNKKIWENLYSFLFDGGGEKAATIGSLDSFNFIQNTGVFSISLWFKMTDYTDGTERYFAGNSNTGSNKGFYFRYLPTTDTIGIVLTSGSGNIINSATSTLTVIDNDWHHLVVTGNDTNIFFYLDNVKEQGSGTMGTKSTGDSTNLLAIANLLSSGAATFKGNLDEVSIYDVALSDSQVSEIYNSGTPNNLSSLSTFTDCQLWMRFDEAAWNGLEFDLTDSSNNAYTGLTVSMEEEDKVLDVPS